MAKHRVRVVGPFLFLGLSLFAGVTYAAGNLRYQPIFGVSNEASPSSYAVLDIVASVITLFACCFCTVCFGFEAFDVRVSLPGRLRNARQQILTYGPGIAVSVSALLTLARLYHWRHGSQSFPMISVDPDIAGRGVLAAFYIPVLSTCASLILGHFQGMDAGTKELGMVLISNLFCLTVNMLIKAIKGPSLHYLEVATACTCMDLTSSALSMTLSNKGALAHRLYVCVSLAVQSTAFCIMTYHLIKVTAKCPETACGSSILICDATRFCLLANISLRICLWASSVWLVWRLSPRMHDAEQMAAKRQGAKWWLVPATATTQYAQWLPLVVMDICNLELLVSYARRASEGNWSDWGQIQSLLPAIIAMLYSGWIVSHSLLKIEAVASNLSLGPTHGMQRWRLFRIPQVILWQLQNLSPVDYIRFQPELWDASARQERTDLSASPLNNVIRHMGKELRGAARMGDSKLVTDLIDQGTDVDSMDKDGWTPLMIAVANGHQDVCRILLDKGARATLHGVNIFGSSSPPSPVHVAVLHESSTILEQFAARDHHVHELCSSIPRNALSGDLDPDYGEDDDPISALCLAVKRDYTDGVRSLLDPDALLMIAMERCDPHVVREILGKFFTKERLQGSPRQGTWLYQKLSELYIQSWDDDDKDLENEITGKDEPKKPQRWAQILRLFERAGTPMQARDGQGRTLLHTAADEGYWPWIKPLTQHLPVDTRDSDGLTALHYAARAFNKRCVDMLLKLGAAVDAQDATGTTPLGYFLWSYGSGYRLHTCLEPISLVLTLASRLEDFNISNASGQRPLDLLWQGFEETPPITSFEYKRTFARFENCCLLYNLLLNAGSPPAYSIPDGPQIADEDAEYGFDIKDLRYKLRPSGSSEWNVDEDRPLPTLMHSFLDTQATLDELEARR